MADGEQTHVDVAVALVTDPANRVLLTFNKRWGSFTLPMTRQRRGRGENEAISRAVLRAGAEALGVPVRAVDGEMNRLAARLLSGRQLADKVYNYHVVHVEPHPEFADELQLARPHLWLSPHLVLSGVYEPVSESAREILKGVLAAFKIPVRRQASSVLVIRRDDPERGLQFLVRLTRNWGYALPAKRWDLADRSDTAAAAALEAAERVAREELGLEPGLDLTIAPAKRGEFTTHGVSETKGSPAHGAPTDYVHSLFDAVIRHPDKIHSDRPLAWVTGDEVRHFTTSASHGEPGAPSGAPGRISRTVHEILFHLGLVAEVVNTEEARFAAAWLRKHGGEAG